MSGNDDSIPILEYDPDPNAVINPGSVIKPIPGVNGCVLTFFAETVEDLARDGALERATTLRSEMGEHPVYEMNIDGEPIGLFACGVGAPLAAGQLDELIAHGYRTFVVCGSAGVLDSAVSFGHVIVCDDAVRDEGTSYHYLPASTTVAPDAQATKMLAERLADEGVAFARARTWTTDGFFRETPSRVARRREQGCVTVEMEASALFAVARFRGVRIAQMLYGGDDVSGLEWDPRQWHDRRHAIRGRLVDLSLHACHDIVRFFSNEAESEKK